MSKHIVVIDDETDILEVVGFNLEAEGYRVSRARTAMEGLRALRDGADLILLDIMLPDMDGFEICKRIRERGLTTPMQRACRSLAQRATASAGPANRVWMSSSAISAPSQTMAAITRERRAACSLAWATTSPRVAGAVVVVRG